MKKYFIYMLILCCGGLFAQSDYPELQYPLFISPRLSGIAAPYTTLEAGNETIATNPASFARLTRSSWSISRISASLSANVLNSLSILSEEKKQEALIENIFSNKDNTNYNLNVTGPIALIKSGKNYSVGIFNRSIIDATTKNDTAEKLLIGEEVFLTGGYGAALFDNGISFISMGFQVKTFVQSFSYALNTKKTDLQKSAKNKFKDLNIMLSAGLGLDFGFLYKYKNYFLLGLTCRDIYTAFFLKQYPNFEAYKKFKAKGKTKYKYIYPDLSIGLASIPITEGTLTTISSWAFYLDYRNLVESIMSIKSKKQNPLFHAAIGTELVVHKILSFRAGMYELYPHFGCGMDFTYFKLDLAAYLKAKANSKKWKENYLGIELSIAMEY